ncbi:diacylglycerol/lipid kinase family protein [Aestuariivirga sp.]|uniref:diacylglycerol/lipid kinase family protein n=1 Tax=Aestuariivirga sp. TaxID=2650926 RepID=UPI003918F340
MDEANEAGASAAGNRPRGTAVLVNRQSGTVRTMGDEAVHDLIAMTWSGEEYQPQILLIDGAEIEPTVRRLLRSGECGRIVVGGGDGTVASVAGLLVGSGIAMGILPLGTMNLMAKAIGMEAELGAALSQVKDAEPRAVDAARAGEQLFLHHVSFGIQPRIVRIRERLGYSSRLTKILASSRALVTVLLRPQSQRLTLAIDGRMIDYKTPALVVSNNIYEDSAWLKQTRLDEGLLGVYAIQPMSTPAYLRLVLDLLRGRWRDNLNLQEERGREVTIDRRRRFGRRRRSIRATIDGELTLFRLPLTITSEPGALMVLVPRPATGEAGLELRAAPGVSPPSRGQGLRQRSETAMADNIENHYNQRPPRSGSSATGWILGVIIALAAIALLWYYGTRGDGDVASTTNNTTVTTEPPAATAPAPTTETESTTTTTTTETAPATGTTTETAPATGTTTETAPATGTTETAPATGTTGTDTGTAPAPTTTP